MYKKLSREEKLERKLERQRCRQSEAEEAIVSLLRERRLFMRKANIIAALDFSDDTIRVALRDLRRKRIVVYGKHRWGLRS